MRTIYICQRCNGNVTGAKRPFAMVKCKSARSSHRLDKRSRRIHDKQAFMRHVTRFGKALTSLAAKIEEQGTLTAILCKRGIAGLFRLVIILVPNRVNRISHNCRTRLCDTSTQDSRPCNGKAIVFADTTVISAIKKFFRFAKLAICKLDLPRRRGLECSFILVIASFRHIHNHGIAVFEHTPARDCGTFDIEFHEV